MQSLIKKIEAVAALSLAAMPFTSLATTIVNNPPAPAFTTFQQVVDIIGKLLGWIYTIFFVVAAIIIVMAAFNYLTSGGDEEKVKSAKQQFIYAIVAIAVALVATAVQFVVQNLVGGTAPTL